MEILNIISWLMKIVTALITENEELSTIITIPMNIVEITVTMLLFTSILNIKTTKRQKIIYVIIIFTFAAISNILIAKPYGTYINIVLDILSIMLIFKTSFLKALIAEIFPLVITSILETLLINFFEISFNVSYTEIITIPIYRIFCLLCIYLIVFILYKIVKYLNFNINILDRIPRKSKSLLILNSIFGIVAIGIQSYVDFFYFKTLPLNIVVLSLLSLVAHFIISIYSLTRTSQLAVTTQNLTEAKLYNQSLTILHDSVRGFKHDFSNIVQAIGGYIDKKDLDGLEKYYSQLVADCQRVNNLTTLNPSTINNPAIYAILASKYLKADELGIQINLNVFLNLNKLNMKIYEFTRVLGILLDNAIEASAKCEEKIINVEIRNDFKVNRQILIIENTYSNKNVDTEKIFEKGYTSKSDTKNPHGLGLWEVRQILKKSKNLNLYTSKNAKFFKQQLEIY